MTIGINVSCNGKYRCPVSYEQGPNKHEQVLDGSKTAPLPDMMYVPFNHGSDIPMNLTIGPEEAVTDEETTSSPSSSG